MMRRRRRRIRMMRMGHVGKCSCVETCIETRIVDFMFDI